MSEDIEIEYRPVKKIVILDLLELSNNELFERVAAIRAFEQNIVLSWAEGIVFIAIPSSHEISEVDGNITKGVFYFSGVSYSQMPTYKQMVQYGVDKIPVIDQSKSKILKTMAAWIKQRVKN